MNPGPPNLSGPPNIGLPPDEEDFEIDLSEIFHTIPSDMKKSKKKVYSVKEREERLYFSQYFRKWTSRLRKLRKSLIYLMTSEMHTKVQISINNDLYRDHIASLMQGQLDYFDKMIDDIKKKKDPLSLELKKSKSKKKVSILVFERLKFKVEIERKKLLEYGVQILDEIKEDLITKQDTRMEPRTGFWTLITCGLMLQNMAQKVEEEFEILMKVSVDYDNVYRHVLVLFLHFVYYLIEELPPFGEEDSHTNMMYNPTKTGYSMAHWIKYRYGTSSQTYMEYERFVKFYVRSFGLIRGRAPQYKRDAYHRWLDRAFVRLQETLLGAELFRKMAHGDSIEGIIVGLIELMKEELPKRKYDDEGRLINQPPGGESALKFLEWIFEAALNRWKRPNFTIQEDIRLSLDMFDFVVPVIKWENELGDRLSIDWLDLDKIEDEEEENA